VWDYLRSLDPDIALLQEVAGIPPGIASDWRHLSAYPTTKGGRPQRFQTVVLAKGEIVAPFPLSSPVSWVQSELARFAGNLVSCQISTGGEEVTAVSVYSPAWPVDRGRLDGINTSPVRLTQNPDVWLSDILLAALQSTMDGGPWVIGGDFNMSETFDQWTGGPRGNREYLDRLTTFGLTECLRHSRGRLTPTFRNTRGGKIVHQMDHLLVTPGLADRLVDCDVGGADRVFT
jgi:endonuclease/exonuclease/phosphatase family metal-dependent hydrolase